MPLVNLYHALDTERRKVIVGQRWTFDLLLVALLTDGHVLIEGVPGVAKTLMARTLATTLKAEFKRVQFTPDLMPSDVIGTNVFDLASSTFSLRRGPVFTNILLGDEINRAPAKTQSALLESMEERQVTIDGVSHPLPEFFMVLPTENPVEYEGTSPSPRPSSTASSSKCSSTTPRTTRASRCSRTTRPASTPATSRPLGC